MKTETKSNPSPTEQTSNKGFQPYLGNIIYLTKLELCNLYGFNKFRHTKDAKARRTYLGLSVLWVFLMLMVWFYVGALVYGLSLLGLAEIVPAYLVMIAALLLFVFGIFKAGNSILSPKGYDILSSLPLRQSSIVISRFAGMYVEDLLLTVCILLPGMLVYGFCNHPGVSFYLVLSVGGLFVPALPLIVSTALGAIITAISSRMKYKSLAQTLLTIILVVALLIGSMSISTMDENDIVAMFQNLTSTIGELIGQIYPPALWLGNAAVHGQISGLLLFVVLSVLGMTVTILLVSRSFHAIIRRMLTTSAKHDYKMQTLKTNNMLSALYRREAKRYFASSLYVTNTIIGPIMALLMSAGILIAGMDTIRDTIPLPLDIDGLVPFLLAAVFTTMTTTSCAISMEGKHLWIVQTLPIPARVWLDSKILLNLSLIAPFYLLSEVCLILALKPNFLQLIWLLVIPALLILFAVVFGITVNLKFPKFDWEKEESVVKQGASAAIGGFGGMLISMLCCGLVAGVDVLLHQHLLTDTGSLSGNPWLHLAKAVICLILFTITIVLYRKNNKLQIS